MKKCTRCGKPAIIQTEKGKDEEKLGSSSINHGWYYKKCFKKGLEMEREAMGYYD